MKEQINYCCPRCKNELKKETSCYVCPNCSEKYFLYKVGSTEIIDFSLITKSGCCVCNRDGETTCVMDLQRELSGLKPLDSNLPTGRKDEVLRALIGKGGPKILDIGCGEGVYAEVVGNDVTLIGLDQCPQRMLLGKNGNAIKRGYKALLIGDALNLPVCSEEFDMVFATEIIEHMLLTRRFIEEIVRVLKVGGRLVMTCPNLVSIWNRLSILSGSGKGFAPHRILKAKSPYDKWSSIRYPEQELHIRFFTPGSLKLLLNEFGLRYLKITGYDPVFTRLGLGKIFASMCSHIVILAEKR